MHNFLPKLFLLARLIQHAMDCSSGEWKRVPALADTWRDLITENRQEWLTALQNKVYHNCCVGASLQAVTHNSFHSHSTGCRPPPAPLHKQLTGKSAEMQFWLHWSWYKNISEKGALPEQSALLHLPGVKELHRCLCSASLADGNMWVPSESTGNAG